MKWMEERVQKANLSDDSNGGLQFINFVTEGRVSGSYDINSKRRNFLTSANDWEIKAAFAGIRRIGQIRHYLDQNSTTRLIHAFVTTKLDACNSLIFGLQDSDISKLQRVQNTAARLVLRASSWDHITPLLESVHGCR